MTPASLESLITALRHAGVAVGVTEILRLEQLFRGAPGLGPDPNERHRRLRAILRAVIVRGDRDGESFDRVFDAWLESAAATLVPTDAAGGENREISTSRGTPREEKIDQTATTPPPPRRRQDLLISTFILLLAVAIPVCREQPPAPDRPVGTETGPSVTRPPSDSPEELDPDQWRQRTTTVRVPTIHPVLPETRWNGWPQLALLLTAIGVGTWLFLGPGRRPWYPDPAPVPTRRGPYRTPLPPPSSRHPWLLGRRELEQLIWGVGRRLAQLPTRRLDLPATVRATVRAAGIPTPIFARTPRHREVWLWRDEAASDALIPRIVDDIAASLRSHGLPVELARYRGVPQRLVGEDGRPFAPKELEERRGEATVALLTDGRHRRRPTC